MLDAVVIACQCRQPVHFTIRSDMFNNPVFRFLLKGLNGIPVYRASEEKEKLRENFNSIDLCRNILKKNGIIIVFSEGITVHDWKLKPLKNGTARIVQHALLDPQLVQTLQVVPAGLTYSDYEHPAKTIIIQTGEIFYPGRLRHMDHTGAWKQAFNAQLFQELRSLIPALETDNREAINIWQTLITNITYKGNRNTFIKHIHYQAGVLSAAAFETTLRHKLKRYFLPAHRTGYYRSYPAAVMLCIPALAGFILNSPFYFPVNSFVRTKTKNTIFYDALLFGLLTMLYPLYILLASVLLAYFTGILLTLWIVAIPFCGWCTVQFWVYTLKIKNHLTLTPSERKYMQTFITGMEFNNKKRQGRGSPAH